MTKETNVNLLKQADFSQKEDKSSGNTEGYFAYYNQDKYLLKQFFKSDEDCKYSQDDNNRIEAIQEFLVAPIFKLLLNDRAPEINLVMGGEGSFKAIRTNKLGQENPIEIQNKDSLYISSKIFDNVKTIKEIIIDPKASKEYFAGSNYQVKNLEKIVAACNICGDADYFFENLILQKQDSDDSKEWKLLKIDHGKSLTQFNRDFQGFIETLSNQFERLGYSGELESGRLKFNIDQYNSYIKEMLDKVNDNIIDTIVDNRINVLSEGGFDSSYFWKAYRFNNNKYEVEAENFNELTDVYKNLLKRNIKNLHSISESLDVISKFNNTSQEFKDSGWLKEFANFKGVNKDPVLYADNLNIQINDTEGKPYDAMEWAEKFRYEPNICEIDKLQQEKMIKKNDSYILNSPKSYKLDFKQEKIKQEVYKINQIDNVKISEATNIKPTAHFKSSALKSPSERKI